MSGRAAGDLMPISGDGADAPHSRGTSSSSETTPSFSQARAR